MWIIVGLIVGGLLIVAGCLCWTLRQFMREIDLDIINTQHYGEF